METSAGPTTRLSLLVSNPTAGFSGVQLASRNLRPDHEVSELISSNWFPVALIWNLNRRIILLAVLSLAFMGSISIPHVHANYTIASTAIDTWPSTLNGGVGIVTSTTVGQASSTGVNEILTAGTFSNVSSQAQLRIYHMTGNSLVLENNQLWSMGSGVYSYYLSGVQVADLDGQTFNETVTIGNVQPFKNQPPMQSQIGIWHWNGASLLKEKLFNFTGSGSPLETRSLAIWSHSGTQQIVTLGYVNRTGVTWAQLGIWSWDGATFTRDSLWNWTATGAGSTGSQGYAVATGDIEGTGIPDIVTVGTDNNGTLTRSEVRVWGWTGSGTPLLKVSRTWVIGGQYSAASSVSIRDLLGNGQKEVVIGSEVFSYPLVRAEITVWQVATSPTISLNMMGETNWQTNSQTSADIIHITTGDVDGSGIAEIISAGISDQPVGTTDVYYGILRTWTWSGSAITLQQSFQYPTVPTALYAVTVADIAKTGKQDIVVGGQQILKGMVEVRDVVFVNSSVSLTVSPSPALAGQSVSVSGTLTNSSDQAPLSSAQVLLEYTNTGINFQILATVTTDSQGRFATSFTPSGPGLYSIRATWPGDSGHMGSGTTVTLTVNKASSVIVLSASSFNDQPGTTEDVSGYLYPATSATVTVTYVPPSGTSITHTTTSDSTGAFSDQAVLSIIGTWNVTASWSGTANTAAASSNTLNIGVNKSSSIIVLSTSTSSAQPGDVVTVSGYLYPATATSLTLTYTSPSGTTTTHTVNSDAAGAFSDQYTVDSAGTWTISASWGGSTTSTSTKSNALSVQTQPQPIGVSLSLYGFIIGIIALGAAVFNLLKKRGPAGISPANVAPKK